MENIFEVAKNMEVEGEEFYRKLAEEMSINELKGVFLFLADQEHDHYKLFEFMQEGKTPTYEEVKNAFSVTKDAFAKIAPGFSGFETLISAENAYEKAVNMEKNAIEFYTSLLDSVETDEQRNALQWVIEEEKKHKVVMESMVEFISEPQRWLENAEFTHLDDL